MDRVNGANWIDIGGGKRGFRSQNAGAGLSGTEVTALHLNAIQEELLYVIEQQGLVPDLNDWTQVYQAIQGMAPGKVFVCSDATVAPNTVLLTPFAQIDAYENGQVFIWRVVVGNTDVPTVKVGGLATIGLTTDFRDMAAGELEVNELAIGIYDSNGGVIRVAQFSLKKSLDAPPEPPNLPQLVAFADGTQTFVPSVYTNIYLGNQVRNNFPASTFDGTTFTVGSGEAGLYAINASVRFNGQGVGLGMRVKVNGSVIAQYLTGGTTGANHANTITAVVRLAVGETVLLDLFHNTGVTQAPVTSETFMTFTQLSV